MSNNNSFSLRINNKCHSAESFFEESVRISSIILKEISFNDPVILIAGTSCRLKLTSNVFTVHTMEIKCGFYTLSELISMLNILSKSMTFCLDSECHIRVDFTEGGMFYEDDSLWSVLGFSRNNVMTERTYIATNNVRCDNINTFNINLRMVNQQGGSIKLSYGGIITPRQSNTAFIINEPSSVNTSIDVNVVSMEGNITQEDNNSNLNVYGTSVNLVFEYKKIIPLYDYLRDLFSMCKISR